MIDVGCVVKLNSGSPEMTVLKYDKIYGKVDCVYFSEVQGKFEVVSVHADCLEKVISIKNKGE